MSETRCKQCGNALELKNSNYARCKTCGEFNYYIDGQTSLKGL